MNARRLAWMSILLIGQLLYTVQGRADSWQHAVKSSISAEYDTNPIMSPTNSVSVWRALFEPGYALSGSMGDSVITAGLAVQMARSSNKILSPDRDSPTISFNWLRPSEAGAFGISTRYSELATRDSGGVDATGRVPESSTRTLRNLSGTWSKELSEYSTLSADTAYEKISYKGGGTYTDYSNRSGGLEVDYASSEQITSFFRVSGNKYMPAGGGPTSSNVGATLGVNWKFEYWDWTIQAGKVRIVGGNSDTQGSIAAHYTGQLAQVTLDAGRSFSPSGFGGFIKAVQARVSWSYALSEYTNTGVDLERQKTFATAMSGGGTNASSGVWIDHNLTSLWKVRTYLRHRTSQGGWLESASSNMLGLSFAYDNTDF